ncbi:MAG: RNA-binding cell elongation regulator Jag/EloR [Bacillota bacterium]|nr:RNA-binding cell elongation regulator Jag/EloR [Bacillota bacterium]
MDYSEKWGVDVEEAVKLALEDLKLSRDEVEITILEEPSRGFFGIGSKLAKVRVEKKKPAAPAGEGKKEQQADVGEDVKAESRASEIREPRRERKPDRKPEDRKREKSSQSREQRNRRRSSDTVKAAPSVNLDGVNKDELTETEDHEALTFLNDVTEKMGLSLSITAKTGENLVYLEMDGKDSGTVIGKRGQTLDAIQYLTSLVVNKDSEKYIKVVVDAENYRAKRQRTLEQLANRLAAKVTRTRKHVRLEPMNPYERKVIHATLQQNPEIITRSEGEEPYRRVVIELKK